MYHKLKKSIGRGIWHPNKYAKIKKATTARRNVSLRPSERMSKSNRRAANLRMGKSLLKKLLRKATKNLKMSTKSSRKTEMSLFI